MSRCSQTIFVRIAGVLLLLVCGSANAVSLTWFINDVTFPDSTTVTGSFDYDAATNIYSDISITTLPGSGLPGLTYTTNSPQFSSSTRLVAYESFPMAIGLTQLNLEFISPLTDAGGTINLTQQVREATCVDLFPTGECEGSSDPSRAVFSNGTVSTIPLPAAAWLFGSALGLLGWLKRRA